MNNIIKKIFFPLFVIITSIQYGCTEKDKVYILHREDSLYTESLKRGELISPPKPKFAKNMFLIDSNSFVYYYSFQEPLKSKGVADDREPDETGLMPNHIFKIPIGMERAFFEENVQKQPSKEISKSIIIALFKDSTKNEFLQYLLKLNKDKTNKLSLQIRMALPEERTVLKYKLKGEHYDSTLISGSIR